MAGEQLPDSGVGASRPGDRADGGSLPEQPLWPEAVQWAAAGGLFVLLVLLAWNAVGMTRWSTRIIPIEREGVILPVDLNRADQTDLLLIPGIGPELARRILDQRARLGRFYSLDELRQVKGVGDATLRKVRPWLFVSTPDATSPAPPPRVVRGAAPEDAPRPVPGGKKVPPAGPIDLNRAGAEQLQKLPGIGPTLAGRIVEYRQGKGGFGSVEELRKVKGIGVKTLDKLRPHLRIGE